MQGYDDTLMQGYDYIIDGESGKTLAVQRSTGEIVDTIFLTVPEGTYFKTPEQQKADQRRNEGLRKKLEQDEAKRAKNQTLGKLGRFFFVVCDSFQDLSDATVARLVFLAAHLGYDGGKLKKTQRTPLYRKDLPALLSLSQSSVDRLMKEAKSYIEEGTDGCLEMTGDVFIRGSLPKGEYKMVQRLYTDAVKQLYRETPVNKHHILGKIFKLLLFINREFNILCWNPDEICLRYVEPLTVSDFCELTKSNRKKYWRLKKDIEKLAFEMDGRQERFCSFVSPEAGRAMVVINPKIMYNGSNYQYVESLGQFREAEQPQPET